MLKKLKAASKIRRTLKLVQPERTAALLIVPAVFAADRLFKNSIEAQEQSTFPRDVSETIRFDRVHNDGFMMGHMKEHPEVVKNVPAAVTAASAVCLGAYCTKKGSTPEKAALALIVGGGLSNLYDRLVYGYVIDYLTVKLGKLKNVAFNIGDAAIFAGTALMAILQLKS